MIRNRLFIFGVVSLALLVAGVTLYWAAKNHILRHTGPAQEIQYLYIPAGAGLKQIANAAARAGLVQKPWYFSVAANVTDSARLLKAGEYEVQPQTDIRSLLGILKSGKTFQRRFAVPEGFSVLEVEQLLQSIPEVDTSSWALPEEGSLLPETYFYNRGVKAEVLVARMQKSQDNFIDFLWANRTEGLPIKSKKEAIILASIVEKETGISSERPVIAAVFLNRLRRGMRLQSDPTVIYGVTNGLPLGRPLRKSELKEETSFNTYRIDGLPPTPISNPGKAAIEAVLHPENVAYLYFVADGKGGHAFAETLREHNKNVREWRRARSSG